MFKRQFIELGHCLMLVWKRNAFCQRNTHSGICNQDLSIRHQDIDSYNQDIRIRYQGLGVCNQDINISYQDMDGCNQYISIRYGCNRYSSIRYQDMVAINAYMHMFAVKTSRLQ